MDRPVTPHPAHAFLAAMAGRAAEAVWLFAQRLARWAASHKIQALGILLAIGTTVSIGQGAPAPAPSAPAVAARYGGAANGAEALGLIARAVNDTVKRLQGNAWIENFGRAVSALLLAGLMIWGALKVKMSGKGLPELFGEWVPVWVAFGLVTFFLDRNAGGQIDDLMSSVSRALGGPGTLEEAFTRGADPFFRAMGAIWEMPRASEVKGGITDMLGGVLLLVPTLVVKAAAILLMVLATVVMLAHLAFSQVSVGVVLGLAPLMVPFLMWQPTKFIFDGWLKFLLTACMLKVVAGVMLTLTSSLMGQMNVVAAEMAAEARSATGVGVFAVDMVQLGMLFLFGALAVLLMAQSPTIANGLLNGVGGSGFSGIQGLGRSSAVNLAASPGNVMREPSERLANRWTAAAGRAAGKAGIKDYGTRSPTRQRYFDRGYKEGLPKKE